MLEIQVASADGIEVACPGKDFRPGYAWQQMQSTFKTQEAGRQCRPAFLSFSLHPAINRDEQSRTMVMGCGFGCRMAV